MEMGSGPISWKWGHSPFPRERSAVAEFEREDGRGERERDGVRHDNGPGLESEAVDEPERHARGEHHVHAERDAAGVARADGHHRLRYEGNRRERGGDVADRFDIHDAL